MADLIHDRAPKKLVLEVIVRLFKDKKIYVSTYMKPLISKLEKAEAKQNEQQKT